MNRRELIKGIGRALCAGATVPFIPRLLPDVVDYRETWGAMCWGDNPCGGIIANYGTSDVYVGLGPGVSEKNGFRLKSGDVFYMNHIPPASRLMAFSPNVESGAVIMEYDV